MDYASMYRQAMADGSTEYAQVDRRLRPHPRISAPYRIRQRYCLCHVSNQPLQ